MRKDLRVAIAGCGRMGRARAQAVERAGATVALLCDTDRERAERLAGECASAPRVAEPGELGPQGLDLSSLDLSGLDAFFSCTPPHLRGPMERAALESGLHVFMEKPVGLTAGQCEPLVGAAAAAGRVIAVGYSNRCRGWMEPLRRQLRTERILGVSATWIGKRYAVPWWSRPEESGGPINEQATHLVDLCRFLVGEIECVQATSQGAKDPSAPVEGAAIALRFANGAVGSLLYSCDAAEKLVDLFVYTPTRRHHLQDWDFHPVGATASELPDPSEVFDVEVLVFLDAVLERDPAAVPSPLEDALLTQRAVDAIGRSLASGRTESPD